MPAKIKFSNKECIAIYDLFKNGVPLTQIAQEAKCSISPIIRILKEHFSAEYFKITEKHIKKVFSQNETEKVCKLFINGISVRKIAVIFKCSGRPIIRILINTLGKKQYKQFAEEHLDTQKKMWRRAGLEISAKLPRTEKQIKANLENIKIGQKVAFNRGVVKKAIQSSQKAHSAIYEIPFKKMLEDENILFEWQKIIDFPNESFIKFCIADFLVDSNIIVEIDGNTHLIDPSYDIKRDAICENLGYKILRFTHEEIQNNFENCIKLLKEEIK